MNILVINLKGGAAKTTNSSIVASYLPNSTLIEIDKINQSDKKIKAKDYKSVQLDFMNQSDEKFIGFEQMLLDEGCKIIDVGAVKLEVFHQSMINADLYNTIDLIIVPCMDGADDFQVAVNYLGAIQEQIDLKKVIFSFNRFNNYEYTTPQEQFSSFFSKAKKIKELFGIDIEDENNYYVIKDSRAIKNAREKGVTLKSLIDTDVEAITLEQRSTDDKAKRLELTKERSLVLNAQNLFNDYLSLMLEKIQNKIKG